MSGARPGTGAVLRSAALLATVAGTVAVGTVLAPVPSGAGTAAGGSAGEAAQPAGRTVRVPAGDAVLVCAGPPASATQALGEQAATTDSELTGDSRQRGSLRVMALPPDPGSAAGASAAAAGEGSDSAGSDPAAQGAAGGASLPAIGEPPPLRLTPLPREDGTGGGEPVPGRDGEGVAVAEAGGGATEVRAGSVDGARPTLAALRTVRAGGGDLAGLSAGGCAAPAEQSWLLGAGTTTGRSAQLVLANPGPAPAAVDVVVLTPAGPVQPDAGAGLALAPGQQRRVFVEGLAPGEPAVAVGVTATAGRVAATLQDTVLQGLQPGGTEDVAPSAPARRLVLPGIAADPAAPDPVLRLAAPGDTDAVVSWRAVGSSGPVEVGGEAAATVPAGGVVEVPLPGLGSADKALLVEADTEVLAAVQVRRGEGDGPQGLSWVQPALPVGGPVAVPLPADGDVSWRLVLAGDGERAEHARLVPLGADGSRGPALDVQVPPGRTASVSARTLAVEDAAGVLLVPVGGGGQLRAGLRLSAPAGGDRSVTSVVPVRPAPEPAAELVVGATRPGSWP